MKSKYPVDQGTTNPISQTPFLDVDSKPDTENIEADCYQGKAVILLDPTTNPIKAYGEANPIHIQISDGITPSNVVRLISARYPPGQDDNMLATGAVQFILNETGTGSIESIRTASIYKNAYATAAGSTAIWTSGVGKKWRILGVQVTVGQLSATAAGPFKIRLLDVAADTGIGVTLSTGALAALPNANIVLSLANIGNGYLAAATNTALNIDLSNAFTAGGVSVLVWGCEE